MKRSLTLFARILVLTAASFGVAAAQVTATDPVLIEPGSSWKYHDGGVALPTAWKSVDYDDAGWSLGRGQFGYGDGDETTALTRGVFTAYFRRSFEIPDAAAVSRLVVSLIRDDGAVVYLNGELLLRSNMPDRDIVFSTPASSAVGPPAENEPLRFVVPATALRSGRNVIAVEVHQISSESADLSFDLGMAAHLDVPTPPTVRLKATRPETMESTPTSRPIPGEFTLTVDGSFTPPLAVFLRYEGSATPDKDYPALPGVVFFEAGQTSKTLTVPGLGDDLVEGDETVVCHIVIPPDIMPYHIGEPGEATVTILDADVGAIPKVILSARDWKTREAGPAGLTAPAVYVLERTGPTDQPLPVFLRAGGTATAGLDYPALANPHVIPAGVSRQAFNLIARDDTAVEGPEIVTLHLHGPPETAGSIPYDIGLPNSTMLVIGDLAADAPEARLDIVQPETGAVFPIGQVIPISALSVWTQGEVDWPVDFYAGDTLIGRSSPPALGRPPIPCLPTVHAIRWENVPVGTHVLTARTSVPDERGRRLLVSPPVRIQVGEDPPPQPPLVFITTEDDTGREFPAAVDAFDPVVFKVTRRGDLSRSLPVFFTLGGSANPDSDYRGLQSTVTLPPGVESLTLEAIPTPDEIEEGVEFIHLRLVPSPVLGPLPTYDIEPRAGDALGVILDDEVAPRTTLEIVAPKDGSEFGSGHRIPIVAGAYSPELDIHDAGFFAGDKPIGSSSSIFDDAGPPGGLFVHRMVWAEAPDGLHELTARTSSINGNVVVSPPVHVKVGEVQPPMPTVAIETTQPISEETAAPLRRLALVGAYKISRTGSTAEPLSVFLHLGGTATPERDYEALPFMVTIPRGAAFVELPVKARPDEITEPIETVVAKISNCPPNTDPPLGVPCFNFRIDPTKEHATVFLRDDGITTATVEINRPRPGTTFELGTPIPIHATAIDIEGAITRLEFLAGETVIGVSELTFIREPDPGTPMEHEVVWNNAPAGVSVLTARGVNATGVKVGSSPVRIEVADNHAPRVAITKPLDGTEFPADTAAIEIVAQAKVVDGYVPKMEFFVDGRKIGETTLNFLVPPPPGEIQTFTFTWREPAPGPHVLTARAKDNDGLSATSGPVTLRVATQGDLPVVIVTPHDPFGVEPGPNHPANTASFRLRRYGSTAAELRVDFSMGGVAENGVDYERLSGSATFPAGKRSVLVTVTPLADEKAEGVEPLVLKVEPQRDDGPQRYRVGRRNRAWAVIHDLPWRPNGPGDSHCWPLLGGLLHLCFPEPEPSPANPPSPQLAQGYRVEATEDLITWTTIHEALSFDDALHFIDPDAGQFRQRFHRVVPDPSVVDEVMP